MNQLSNPAAHVDIDPHRGASILHFGATSAPADNVLASYHWESPLPQANGYGTSQQDWLSGYRGGWQLLTPNAGAESSVAGVRHPFHGEVSTASWHVIEQSNLRLSMRTATHGPLIVTRIVELHPYRPRVTVRTILSNPTPIAAQAILVEHIALANDDEAVVRAPAKSGWEFDPASPEYDGRRTVWEQSPVRKAVGLGQWRVASLVDGSEGWIELRRRTNHVRVTWDPEQLPYLWYWQERGTPQFPFFGRADITGLEPASAKFSDGLAAAIARNEAWTIEAGGELTVTVAIELLTEESDRVE